MAARKDVELYMSSTNPCTKTTTTLMVMSQAFDKAGRKSLCRVGQKLEKQRLQELCTTGSSRDGADQPSLYDRVLVDAECTHDGSYRHMIKVADVSTERLTKGFLNWEKLENLEALQRGLIR